MKAMLSKMTNKILRKYITELQLQIKYMKKESLELTSLNYTDCLFSANDPESKYLRWVYQEGYRHALNDINKKLHLDNCNDNKSDELIKDCRDNFFK